MQTEMRSTPASRFGGAAGMPRRSRRTSARRRKRLLTRLRSERAARRRGPRARRRRCHADGARARGSSGTGTDIIFRGLRSDEGIDFGELHRVLVTVIALYLVSGVLMYLQGFVLAGIVQRTMYQLRRDAEDKLHRVPLGYVDRQPRGDLLSRVTNDIDNISQSLQQTLSQMLTSILTVVGVLVMMLIVSPVLALVALVTIPLSMFTVKQIARRSRARFIAQWRTPGC
jgi:ATP-binding cassette subfamily B protein